MSDLCDVKISVRSSVNLLPEIKGLLSVKPNHESYPNSKKWRSKKANVIPRGLAWSKLSNPNVALISSHEEMRQAWFMASVDFIKGLAYQDGKILHDDEARVNCIEHKNRMCSDTEVGRFVQDEKARVNGIEHHNGMCGDTEVGNFVQDEEARVDGIEHHNRMCGYTEDGNFLQDEEARVNGIEHHNGMCGDIEDGNFVEGIDETICPKTNQMSVKEGDGVLDSVGDDVDLSQTNEVIQQAVNISTMSSTVLLLKKRKDDEFDELTKRLSKLETSQTFLLLKNLLKTDVCIENESTDFNHNDTSNHIGGLSTEAKPSSSSSHPGNDKDASHLDDLMKIDGENVKDGYPNSQDHLHLLIKVEVVNYEDDYMLMSNDEEKPVKSSLNDMELEQEPDKIAVKQGILEQQPNAPKGNTIVFEETVEVKVEEKPGLGRGLGSLKVKKKNCQRALRPNYLLRSAKDKKKKLAMALKPPFGQQSATTPVPKKRKSRIMKTEVIVPPFDLELEIRTGVVTLYDSLGWAGASRRRWWRQIQKSLPEKLTVYLVMHGIFESNSISANDYKITYKYVDAPFQASLFGDCVIWVCIFIYGLCRNLPLTVDDPLEIALAYRERMLEYFWSHKIPVKRISLDV
ncbi:hypothetical protein Tco_0585470 [Tanacetum coccineum]